MEDGNEQKRCRETDEVGGGLTYSTNKKEKGEKINKRTFSKKNWPAEFGSLYFSF